MRMVRANAFHDEDRADRDKLALGALGALMADLQHELPKRIQDKPMK